MGICDHGPPGDVVEVWSVDLPAQVDPDDLALLDDGERDRAVRFHNEASAAAFVARRSALRRIVARALGVSPVEVAIVRAPCPRCGSHRHGPPHIALRGAPAVSVSSSGSLAVVATARHGPIGVDIELTRPPPFDPLEAAAAVAGASEAAHLTQLQGPARLAAFHRMWSRKEAVAKAAGVGFLGRLRDIDTVPQRPGSLVLTGTPVHGGPAVWWVQDLAVSPGFHGAVARAGSTGPLVRLLVGGPSGRLADGVLTGPD